MIPHTIRRFATSTALTSSAVMLMALTTGATEASPPDLVPVSIVGPQITHVGTDVTVHISTANLGGALLGDYTAEVLLGKGVTPSADDVVVASYETSIVSNLALLASIPKELDSGTYHWSIRLVDAEGELNTGNNQLVGLATSIIKIDLAVLDPAPIEVFARPTDGALEPIEVTVENAGSLGTILIYKTTALSPAPWLTIDPPENFAFAGGDPTPNRFLVDHAGLEAGTYETTIRFQNVNDADDFEEMPFSLTVGEPKFVPGDRIQGQISEQGDADDILFDGLAGMKVSFWVKSTSGDLNPVLTVLDPEGNVVEKLKFKHSSKNVKKTVKLKMSGEHRLAITGKKSKELGNYRIKTARKMPKKAKAYTTEVKAGEVAKVLALGGAVLDIACEGAGSSFTLEKPEGQVFDMTGSAQDNAGVIVIEKVELTSTGSYGIMIGGLGGGKATLHLTPVQPKVGSAKIYLP